MNVRKLLAASGFGAAVATAAFAGSRFNPTGGRGEWYDALEKPAFTPPSIAFPIVWTTLYILMAVSAYRVWREGEGSERTRALSLWGLQLALNGAWSPLFFGARAPALALADLVALFLALGIYTREARRVDRTASALMIPYLLWVAFAGAINVEIVRLNRG